MNLNQKSHLLSVYGMENNNKQEFNHAKAAPEALDLSSVSHLSVVSRTGHSTSMYDLTKQNRIGTITSLDMGTILMQLFLNVRGCFDFLPWGYSPPKAAQLFFFVTLRIWKSYFFFGLQLSETLLSPGVSGEKLLSLKNEFFQSFAVLLTSHFLQRARTFE